MRKHGVKPGHLVRVAENFPHKRHSSRAKDSKTMGFGGIFGYFLPLLAESAPPEAKQGVQCAVTTDCHSQCAHWLRNDIFFARGACGIGRRFGYSCPPLRQPIPGHYRGRQSGRFLEIASLLPPPAALRLFLPTVAPTDSRPLPWPPIGALPRNSLASSATGGASAILAHRRANRFPATTVAANRGASSK